MELESPTSEAYIPVGFIKDLFSNIYVKTLQCFTKGKLLGNADLTLFQPGACIHTGKKGNICTLDIIRLSIKVPQKVL